MDRWFPRGLRVWMPLAVAVVGSPPYPAADPVPVAPVPPDVEGEVSDGWPATRADVGEGFWSDGHYKVVRGTTLLAPPTALGWSAKDGTLSIFEVTGDPDEVLDAFVAQRAGEGISPDELMDRGESYTWTREGVTVANVRWLDGQGQTFRIWERDGEPTLLRVETTPSD